MTPLSFAHRLVDLVDRIVADFPHYPHYPLDEEES